MSQKLSTAGNTSLTAIRRVVRSVRAFSRELAHPSPRQQPLAFVESPRRLKLGVALGGGFARGLVHIGVLKALEDAAIPVDFVAGTSVGAIVGACYCAGVTAEELKEIARATRFKDFARWTFSRYGLCSNDRMRAFFARILKVTTFEELKVPLAVTATDFQTGESVVFRQGALVGPIRASCAYPGMFLPVELDGRRYVDGMLAYAVPTTPLRQMGADRVLGIYLSAHWTQKEPRNLFEVIGQCFSIAQDKMCDTWKRDADRVLEPNVNGYSYNCFERAPELIEMGEIATRAIIPELRLLLNLTAAVDEFAVALPPLGPPTEPNASLAV
jgi:NTE family protein